MLAALIVVLFLAIVGGNIGQPAKWGSDFKVHLGLDLTSGTTVTLQAKKPKGVSDAAVRRGHDPGQEHHGQPGERGGLHRGPGAAAGQQRDHRVAVPGAGHRSG